MTVYSEQGCPFKDDCPDPEHNHTTIKSILEELAESYYPEHECGDMWKERNAELIETATQQIQELISSEVLKARVNELELFAATINKLRTEDGRTPIEYSAVRSRLAKLEHQRTQLRKVSK